MLVVALGFATTLADEDRLGLAAFAVIIGMIPAVITGLVVGWIADVLPRFRLPVIVAIPITVVMFLGAFAWALDESGEPVISAAVNGFACIPALVGAIILERWTRPATPDPVPLAIVA